MKQPKSISEMTVKELKKYIRKETRKANTRLKNIGKRKRGVSRAVEEELNYLKRQGIIGKRGRAKLGFRGKRKEELQRQARELDYFNQWTGAEKETIAQDKDWKKYQTFKSKHPEFSNYSYQDWRDIVNVFASMEDKLTEFEYEDTKRLHIEATEKGSSVNFLKAMENAHDEAQGKGFDTDDMTDLLRSELFV